MGTVRALATLVACICIAAPAARAGDDPYASLLAPAGVCGAEADELSLDPVAARAAMLCLTNYARVRSGLSALRTSTTLDVAGSAKLGADLSCDEFSHTPCGKPFESVFAAYLAGASSCPIGENIAWGTGDYGTPRSTIDLWLNSAGHRANILNPAFTELGIGYLPDTTFEGSSGATLWSQEFGGRSPAGRHEPKRPRPRVDR